MGGLQVEVVVSPRRLNDVHPLASPQPTENNSYAMAPHQADPFLNGQFVLAEKMSLCALCLSQLDRPGYFPPHPKLVKSATLRTTSGESSFAYRCRQCGETLLLTASNPEAPDRWTRLAAGD